MEKKIIKAMFANAVAKGPLRPVMEGVHFDEDCCVASDGHVLALYKKSFPACKGKTTDANGEVIEGRYPNYKSVIPAERIQFKYRLDLAEMHEACKFHTVQRTSNRDDIVYVQGTALKIASVVQMLNVLKAGGQLQKAEAFKGGDSTRPVIFESEDIFTMVMPYILDNLSQVDAERETPDTRAIFSYEALVYEWATKSSVKKQKTEFSWLDE